jgi:hypothetical protein
MGRTKERSRKEVLKLVIVRNKRNVYPYCIKTIAEASYEDMVDARYNPSN